MRPVWSGALSFGLINIPVQLFSGTNEHSSDLTMLHKKDLSPIRFARICKTEEKEVPWKDIVKGYEYEQGKYVVLTEEDFTRAAPEKSKSIEIQYFTDEAEVDSVLFDKPYHLEPSKGEGAANAYFLLREALQQSGKVGVAIIVMHLRQHVALIKPYKDGLILQQLRYQSQVREFDRKTQKKPIAKEVQIAVQLIDQLSAHFDASRFRDTYHDTLKAMIKAKTKKQPKTAPKKGAEKIPKQVPAKDIMEQLKASLKIHRLPQPHSTGSHRRKAS